MKRFMAGLVVSASLLAPVTVLGDEHHRYYDRERRDWHEWNEHENRAYRHWLMEERREQRYREYARLRRKSSVPTGDGGTNIAIGDKPRSQAALVTRTPRLTACAARPAASWARLDD